MLHTVADTWIPEGSGRRILIAVGTRPEAIKLAPLIRELRARSAAAGAADDVFVCATGQHQDMVEDALALFGVRADLDLGLMTPGQTLASVSARILSAFERVLEQVRPEWVVVQGDTATTAMAGLAAFYAGIRVAHVEAGLRTHDLQHPFPEEFNRRMVGIFTSMHFAATEGAKRNLLREGVPEREILVTGNTGIDALRGNCARLGVSFESAAERQPGPVRVLVTAHRRENLDGGILEICTAIRALTSADPGLYQFVWPLHPNPKVGDLARRLLSDVHDVTLTGAASYDRLLWLLSQCDLVLTDSGGLQEEAPSFGKPVLILREVTERPEGLDAGIATLVGTDPARIEAAVRSQTRKLLHAEPGRNGNGRASSVQENPYGDGHAAERIADFFGGRTVHEFSPGGARAGRTLPVPPGARQFARLHAMVQ